MCGPRARCHLCIDSPLHAFLVNENAFLARRGPTANTTQIMVTACVVLHVLVLVLLVNTSLATDVATTSNDSEPCPPGFEAHNPGFWCAATSKAPFCP